MGQPSGWDKADVLRQLEQSGSAEPGLQVFLKEDVPHSDLETLAKEIVTTAGGAATASIGPVSRIAKSFAVHGEMSLLRRIADDSRVKSILPTAVDDILPAPQNKS